jgi:hypothetical protein
MVWKCRELPNDTNAYLLILQLAVMEKDAKFAKEQWKKTVRYPWTIYKDNDIRRQFQKHSVLGYAALEGEKLAKVPTKNEIILNTKKIASMFMLKLCLRQILHLSS